VVHAQVIELTEVTLLTITPIVAAPIHTNGRVKAIRRLFAWAMEAELITTNPARDVSYKRRVTEGHHAWTEEEIAQFEGRHQVGSKARLALALLVYTGVRRSDVVLLGRQHIRQGWLKFVAQKGPASKARDDRDPSHRAATIRFPEYHQDSRAQ
jgi:integrase